MSIKFRKFQEFDKSRFGGPAKDRYFLKFLTRQHKLFRDCKRGKLVSYFLNNAAKTCFYGLKISENIEIEFPIFNLPQIYFSSRNERKIVISNFSQQFSSRKVFGNFT